MPFPNPLGLNYQDGAVSAAWEAGSAVIAGRGSGTLAAPGGTCAAPTYQQARARGCKAFQYINVVDRRIVGPWDKRFLDGAPAITGASQWQDPSTGEHVPMCDIRVPTFGEQIIGALVDLIRSGDCDGVFLDCWGTKIWNPFGSGWTPAVQAGWRAAIADLSERMLAAVLAEDPAFLLVANNIPEDNGADYLKFLDGIMFEGSAYIDRHRGFLEGARYRSGRAYCMAIKSPAWLNDKGLMWYGSATTYAAAGTPFKAGPYEAIVLPGGGPQPDPDPDPEPQPDCSECEAALAAASEQIGLRDERIESLTAERDQALAGLGEAQVERDEALTAKASAESELAEFRGTTISTYTALRDDLAKIHGSASSTAGDPWQRLRGIKTAAERALGRLPS